MSGRLTCLLSLNAATAWAILKAFEVVLLRLRTEAAGRLGRGGLLVCLYRLARGQFCTGRVYSPAVIGKTIADRQSIMLAARYAIAHASEAKSALEATC